MTRNTPENDGRHPLPGGGGLWRDTAGGKIYVKRRVPLALVGQPRPCGGKFGKFVTRTTGTSDLDEARQVREDIWAAWTREFRAAECRKGNATTADVLAAIEAWRYLRVAEAAGIEARAEVAGAVLRVPASLQPSDTVSLPAAFWRAFTPTPTGIGGDVVARARAYFEQHDGASQDLAQPHAVTLALSRLDAAEREPGRWREIPGAEEAFAAVVDLVAKPVSDEIAREVRPVFLRALREVVQHGEAERLRSAAILAAVNHITLKPANVRSAAQAAPVYIPRPDDLSIKEVVEAYETEIRGRVNDEVFARKYAHMARAMVEVLGEATLFRSITVREATALRNVIRDAPASASKRFSGMKLADTITAMEAHNDAQEDEADCYHPPAPATVTSYVTRLSALWKWAIERGYADGNPMRGLGVGNRPETERRGFDAKELQQIFDALKDEREANSWKFWLPAVAAFNGARMGEILALKTSDFREEGGRFYFRLSEFDATGRRDKSKSLKTAQSRRRLVPHLELIDAGLAEFVQSAPAGRLFPNMTSSDASEWFARHLTSLGLKHPNTTFHSLRHGFRTACRKSGIDKEYALALGGWAGLDVSDGYGDSQEVEVLAREIDKLKLGEFTLKAA